MKVVRRTGARREERGGERKDTAEEEDNVRSSMAEHDDERATPVSVEGTGEEDLKDIGE